MSVRDDPAFPDPSKAKPGLTIHQLATLQLFAVAANLPNYSPLTCHGTLEACARNADVYVHWLNQGAT